METIKTAVVVVLLLAVLFGVYVVLNRPDLGPSPETAWDTTPDIDLGKPVDPSAPFPGSQQAYGASGLPEMPPTLDGQAAQEKPQAPFTDRVPTLAAPPLRSYDERISPPDLTTISENRAEPDAPDPRGLVGGSVEPDSQDPALGSVYDSTVKGAVEMTLDDRKPDEGNSFHVEDEMVDAADPQSNRVFQNQWNAAIGQLEKEEWEEALLTLSHLYGNPDVTGEARSRLIDLLDPLAGKVIYSNEHTLAPYEVRPGDTLQGIADQYQVPMALLQNINGIRDPNSLPPGTQLKVLRGPFRAEINRKQSELVLFLGRKYAGSFPISVGNDPNPQPAEYKVLAKHPGREYYAPDESKIPARAPGNPYGDWWIGLGADGLVGDVCIHGSTESIPAHGGLGCVSLSSADAADVYHILNVGSKVLIR